MGEHELPRSHQWQRRGVNRLSARCAEWNREWPSGTPLSPEAAKHPSPLWDQATPSHLSPKQPVQSTGNSNARPKQETTSGATTSSAAASTPAPFRYTKEQEVKIWQRASQGDYKGAYLLFHSTEQFKHIETAPEVEEYVRTHPRMKLRPRRGGRRHEQLFICKTKAVWEHNGNVNYTRRCNDPYGYSSEDICRRHIYEHHLRKPRPRRVNDGGDRAKSIYQLLFRFDPRSVPYAHRNIYAKSKASQRRDPITMKSPTSETSPHDNQECSSPSRDKPSISQPPKDKRNFSPLAAMSTIRLNAEITQEPARYSRNITRLSMDDYWVSDLQIFPNPTLPQISFNEIAKPPLGTRLDQRQHSEVWAPSIQARRKRVLEEDNDRPRKNGTAGFSSNSGSLNSPKEVKICCGSSQISDQAEEAPYFADDEPAFSLVGLGQEIIPISREETSSGSSLLDWHYRSAFQEATGGELEDWYAGLTTKVQDDRETLLRDSGDGDSEPHIDSSEQGNHNDSTYTAAVGWKQDIGESVDFEEIGAEFMKACFELETLVEVLNTSESEDSQISLSKIGLEVMEKAPSLDSEVGDEAPINEEPTASSYESLIPPSHSSGGKWMPGSNPAPTMFLRYTAVEERAIWDLASQGDYRRAHSLFHPQERHICLKGVDLVEEYMEANPHMRLRRKKDGHPHDKLYVCRATAVWKSDGTVEYRERLSGSRALGRLTDVTEESRLFQGEKMALVQNTNTAIIAP
ncbi:hypothetical protein M408DRAFT_12192 [Serendipita vermifera MAFF 305830]|uniref:Uncharacterized protein n=1 Tax=Serendipita vermifera MAFF 305830 TaxID=933852 RepID=A0A0C2W6V1_SERVB|nr:hypothetical protein M408DRAFT_12192 [Serendipita vermifera MAFF 305830]